jgi:hypothetical protein
MFNIIMWKFRLYSLAIVFIMFSTTSIDRVNYLCKAKTTIAILEEENHSKESGKKLINEKYLVQNLNKPINRFSTDETKLELVYLSKPKGFNYVYIIDFPPEKLV